MHKLYGECLLVLKKTCVTLSNYVVNPFFTLNSCLNPKTEHSNNIESRWLIFFPTLSSFYKDTNFSAILILGSCLVVSGVQSNDAGVPGLSFFLGFFFFFFKPDRPTQYQETHWTLNEKKKKKKGMV